MPPAGRAGNGCADAHVDTAAGAVGRGCARVRRIMGNLSQGQGTEVKERPRG
jgi:hypothetical protein